MTFSYAGGTLNPDQVWLQEDGGALTLKEIPGWHLVETLTVAANTNTQDLTSTLDGDNDGEYMLIGYIINNGVSQCAVYLRLNGADDTGTQQRLVTSGSTVATSLGNESRLAEVTNGESALFCAHFIATKTGKPRFYYVTSQKSSGAAYRYCVIIGLGTGTNITSIGVKGSIANSIGQNSELKLYKKDTTTTP